MISPSDRLPKGAIPLTIYGVYYTDNELIILGDPKESETDISMHNCDEMGCGSLDHVILRLPLSEYQISILKECE